MHGDLVERRNEVELKWGGGGGSPSSKRSKRFEGPVDGGDAQLVDPTVIRSGSDVLLVGWCWDLSSTARRR